MKITDQIQFLNTAFKRTDDGNPIYQGHYLPKIAEWTRRDGFKWLISLQKDNECLACPIVAIVETKIRESNLELTIVGKNAGYKETETTPQIENDVTIDRKIYEPTEDTESTVLSIPRYTRHRAIFLLSGLGNKIYEIKSITDNIPDLIGKRVGGGKVGFYALASEGSKIIYYLGTYKIYEYLKEVLNAIWSSPTKCPTCKGTGIVEGVSGYCPECGGCGFSGYNATKSIQIKKGFDVGLTREKFKNYPLTEKENIITSDFVNKIWTQKWWVTPTIKEIKRLFAYFYGVIKEEIIIDEKHHLTMPHWDLLLPSKSIKSPFNVIDNKLMTYIAESVTPAGVNVFVGFYELGYFGDVDAIQNILTLADFYFESSIEPWFSMWYPRFSLYNGWQEACNVFETGNIVDAWTVNNAVIKESNDRFRRVLCLQGNGAYAERDLGSTCGVTGCSGVEAGIVEWWTHPETSTIRTFFKDCDGNTGFWIEYSQGYVGFANNSGLFYKAKPDSDYHIKVNFNVPSGSYSVYINRNLGITGNSIGGVSSIERIRFENTSNGTGMFDCLGWNWASEYEAGDNWQDLYPWGWGIKHNDYIQEWGLDRKYIAKYDFESDPIGGNPAGWTLYEGVPYPGTITIIDDESDHNHVVEIHDTWVGLGCRMYQSFPNQEKGTTEQWLKLSDVTKAVSWLLFEGESKLCGVGIQAGNWQCYETSGWVNMCTATNNTWYHIRIDFECGEEGYQGLAPDTFYVYVNKDKYGPYGFKNVANNVNKIEGITGDSPANYYYYIDAVDYSWADGYYYGRNIGKYGLYEDYFRKCLPIIWLN